MHVCNACWREVVDGDAYVARCGHQFCASTRATPSPPPLARVPRNATPPRLTSPAPAPVRRRRGRPESAAHRRVPALSERPVRGQGHQEGAAETDGGARRDAPHGPGPARGPHRRVRGGAVLVRATGAGREHVPAAHPGHRRAPRGGVQGQATGGARRVQEGEAEAAGPLGARGARRRDPDRLPLFSRLPRADT